MSRRLARFRVEGLFGLYTHDIALNQSARVTAIIGPNGLGKTICLKLIDALFNHKYSIFYSVQFVSCSYYFDDGASVLVAWQPSPNFLPLPEKDETTRLTFTVRMPSGEIDTWQPDEQLKRASRRLRDLERYLPFLTQIGPETWLDDRTGQQLTIIELIEQHRSRLPESINQLIKRVEAKALSDILEGVNCHLIETQRLLVIPETDQEFQYRRRSNSEAEPTQLAVERKAQTLSRQIQSILTQYASLSQSLDRSFPQRILRGVA